MVYRKKEKKILQDTENIIKETEKRGHIFIEGEYVNRDSRLIVYCPIHDEIYSTTFGNYNRARTGMPCCGNEQVSNKLKKRKFSKESINKMSQSAFMRPSRGGMPRSWRKSQNYRIWRKQVTDQYDNKCSITGLSETESINLETHHLYSVSGYSDFKFIVENGIVLTHDLHVMFHNKYEYGKNNIDQFQSFLKDLLREQQITSTLISSRANPEGFEGSETRAYDPDRVMKLHERLEGLKVLFENIPEN